NRRPIQAVAAGAAVVTGAATLVESPVAAVASDDRVERLARVDVEAGLHVAALAAAVAGAVAGSAVAADGLDVDLANVGGHRVALASVGRGEGRCVRGRRWRRRGDDDDRRR